jgi:hypothetical protein
MTSLFSWDKQPKLRLVYIYSIDKNPSCASCLLSLQISQTEVSPVLYSGLQKHCNVLQFQIVCSVALYGMEITLHIIERE